MLVENTSHYNVIIPSATAGGRQVAIPPNSTAEVEDEDWEAYASRKHPILITRGYLRTTEQPAIRRDLKELQDMHHRAAAKRATELVDLDQIEGILARETRPSVRRALQERLQELTA